MEKRKFDELLDCVQQAYYSVAREMLEFSVEASDETADLGEERVSIVIGMTGKNKGRILFEMNRGLAEVIAEAVNYEPLSDPMELYLCTAEFTNIFCGNAVTLINNKFRGTEMRLTPPAVFAGKGMEISTPNITSSRFYITSEHGAAYMDVGFEGV